MRKAPHERMRSIALAVVCLVVSAPVRADDDWGARRDPFDRVVVERYKANLARDPHDTRSLGPLVSLYKRFRNLDALESEYRTKLGKSEDWATLVVLARLPRKSRSETIALWKRAVAAKPDDARGWLAVAEAAHTDTAFARDAYQRAAKLATSPRVKQVALRKLVLVASTANDARIVDAAYAELIALSPKDGKLWLDRGNAQLGAKQYEAARQSFAMAETLSRTYPEQQLTAMMNQGIALGALDKADEAIAQFERTLAKVPRGYYLARDLVTLVVDTERRRGRLGAAIAWLEKRWPERTRGHFEWAMLGDLHKEARDEERALDAYRKAVGKAPTEVATQRKLIALLDKLAPDKALAQHEAAARVAPGDANLQLDLAKRYHANKSPKAIATLEALARRMSQHVGVRADIARLYEEWSEPERAIAEYEAIAKLEPRDPEHAIVLGEAYWRIEDPDKARAAWQRLDKINTREALFRHAEVLLMHEIWDDAADAYTKALALDPVNADAHYGRARAREALGEYPDAVEDARRAVALTAHASHADGLRNRQLLVRIFQKWQDANGDGLRAALERWRFAFERGDMAAGYLLAAHHSRIHSHQQHDVLVQLYRGVPTDDSLGIAVARSFLRKREFARARSELERIARRSPDRNEEITKLVEQVDEERERVEREIRWEEEEGRARASGRTGKPDIVGRTNRTGMRLELGADVRNTSSATIGVGIYRSYHLTEGTAAVLRLDFLQRDDYMDEVNAVAMGGGLTRRIVDARKFELAVGVATMLELRYGSDNPHSAWARAGIAGDVSLELLPRALPAIVGLRFQHQLTDDANGSAVLLSLGFEVR